MILGSLASWGEMVTSGVPASAAIAVLPSSIAQSAYNAQTLWVKTWLVRTLAALWPLALISAEPQSKLRLSASAEICLRIFVSHRRAVSRPCEILFILC